MNDAEILQLRWVAWRRWMQKFCTTLFFAWFTTVPTTNGWCRNSASQFGRLKTVDAEILHDLFLHLILCLIYNKWMMQKFCISNRWLEKCGCRNSAWPFFRLIRYLIYNKWMMQKFCISNQWLKKCGCRNSAWPYFPLNLLSYLQQMNDAEILHFKSVAVAWKLWMQKFCMTFFPLNSLRFLQQMNNAEILHLKSVAWNIWMQKICTFFSAYSCNLVLSRQQMNDAEILHVN